VREPRVRAARAPHSRGRRVGLQANVALHFLFVAFLEIPIFGQDPHFIFYFATPNAKIDFQKK
jgi:hypothetical protein